MLRHATKQLTKCFNIDLDHGVKWPVPVVQTEEVVEEVRREQRPASDVREVIQLIGANATER